MSTTKSRRRTKRVIKHRTKLDFESKMKIYEKYYKDRPSISSLASEWDVCRSTITRIIQDTVSYQKILRSNPKLKSLLNQDSAICEMEKLLTLWIEDRIQRNLPMSARHIQAKATDLYDNVKQFYLPIRLCFKAHDEWLNQYLLRAGYTDLNLLCESDSDMMAKVKSFPDELKALIKVAGYLPQQVFNVDRLLLFWKSMPDGTFISQEAEKIASDRVTLVLGSNARGDCKLKPLLVYNTDKPHGVPVHYRSSASAWLTAGIFEEWLLNDFVSETKEYCQQWGIPYKILLLLDNAQLYRDRLNRLHPNVNVVLLPRNTAPYLQPMDQGIKSIFKAFYFSHTLNMVTQATQGDSDIMVQDFCESYNIRMGATNIKQAWDDVSKTFLAVAWKAICPQFLDANVQRQDTALYQGIKRQILYTANKLGFEMKMRDVENLIQSKGIDLTNKNLSTLARLIDAEEANGQIGLPENGKVKKQEPTDDENLLTAYSPKHNTSNEDEDSMSSVELIIDCIKVEEPELVEHSPLYAIPKENMQISSPTNEVDTLQVIDCENGVKESQTLSPQPSIDSFDEKPLKIEESYQDTVVDESPLEEKPFQNSQTIPARIIAEEIELAFDHVTCAMEKFESIDPNNARFQAVRSAVNDMLSCYREMFEENRQAENG